MHTVGEAVTSSAPGKPITEPPSCIVGDDQASYEYIAFQINREDGLVNYRLTWMLQLNALLFAALALLSGTAPPSNSGLDSALERVIPIAGIITSLSCLLGVVAANIAIWDLKELWRSGHYKWPRPFGRPMAYCLGLVPSMLLPVVFVGAWVYMIIKIF